VTSDLLIKYLLMMELRFDAMLYSNLSNENSDAGRRSPTPVVNNSFVPRVSGLSKETTFHRFSSALGPRKINSVASMVGDNDSHAPFHAPLPRLSLAKDVINL